MSTCHCVTGCRKWRATHDGDPNGRRNEKLDQNCDYEVQDDDVGYCECTMGKRAMKKGREPLAYYGYPYNSCNKACETKGLLHSVN